MLDTNLITKQTDERFVSLDPVKGEKIRQEGCYFKCMAAWPQYDIGAILSQEQELEIWNSSIQAKDILFVTGGFSKLQRPHRITMRAYTALGKTGVNSKSCSQVKWENLTNSSEFDPSWTPAWYSNHTFVTACFRTAVGGTHWKLCRHDKTILYDPYPGLALGEILGYAYYIVGDV